MARKPKNKIEVGGTAYIFRIGQDWKITYQALTIKDISIDRKRVLLCNMTWYPMQQCFADPNEGLHETKKIAMLRLLEYGANAVSGKDKMLQIVTRAKRQADYIYQVYNDQGTEIFKEYKNDRKAGN